MKLQPRRTAVADDPRALPLPLFVRDDGTAEQIRFAGNSQDAWAYLGLSGERGDMDQDVMDKLTAAATAACTTSDAIGKGLTHFGDLPPGEDPPEGWVERMVELHKEELEQFWALDDLAWQGLRAGGWTATEVGRPPPADDPVERMRTRARWQAEGLKPTKPALWCDKIDRLLTAAVTVEDARVAGRMLVQAVTHWRFTNWRAQPLPGMPT